LRIVNQFNNGEYKLYQWRHKTILSHLPTGDRCFDRRYTTDTEIDAAFGFTPAQAAKALREHYKILNGSGLLYDIESDGVNWSYVVKQ